MAPIRQIADADLLSGADGMTKRAAVTKAQMRRAIEAFEAMGKTVAGAILRPDGSWEVRLTDGRVAHLSSDQQAEDEWDKALGLQ